MKTFTKILESLEIDKNLDKELVESVERYGETPESGTADSAKFEDKEDLKVNSGETNEGGTGIYNPGEKPESGTADSAKFEKEDDIKSSDVKPEEIIKDFGNGEQEFGSIPDQKIEGTGDKLKEDEEPKEHEEKSKKEVFTKLIGDESEAIEHYTCALEHVELDDEERAKIEEILKDEKDHLGILQLLLSNIDGVEPEEVEIEDKEETVEPVTEDEEIEDKEDSEEEPEEETSEESECLEPATIVIDNDNNEVTITFNEEPTPEDVDCAVKKFCGEEFFTELEPVADEENKLVYKFTVKEFNKDEDLYAEADALEETEE